MITSNIGKIFLKAYNEKYKTRYDAKSFFIEQYYPLFFDQQKYLMTAGNSPLENPKLSWEKMIRGQIPFEDTDRRKKRFDLLMDKIDKTTADASIAIGYPSQDVTATTSGQVSNININIPKDDIYLSWIGAGLGVGMQGGYSILFNNPQILLDIFDGWGVYRKALNETSNLKGNQINTWNGQWLVHLYSDNYFDRRPMAGFDPFLTKDGLMMLDTQSWTNILISISKRYTDPRMMGYVYNYGQTNTTIGFIPFVLEQIRRPIDLYAKFFGIDSGKKAEKLWGTAFGFSRACEAGVIGLRALEPKGLREYMEKGKIPKVKEDQEQKITFNTYQIWIMAMLNNEDLWGKAELFAKELQNYSLSGERGKKVNTNKVNAVLETTNKPTFIKSLVEIVSDAPNKQEIHDIASLVNKMPTENVPYFLTLIRFHFASINNLK
ncbi:MAG: hypothetical protein ACRC6R_00150 [Bacteroidales bacterium]